MPIKSTPNDLQDRPGVFLRKDREEIDRLLGEWFSEFQRTLNFRKTRDAYSIMVAEFMLQQTTVAAVEAYFARFLTELPSVDSLANAPEEKVLGLWAGLGYYRRARQLHAAAKAIVQQHNGVVPANVDDLRQLPGIGRYTAGAIASTAHDVAAPVLEANTTRVFARLAGIDGIAGETRLMAALWRVAEELVCAARSPRVFNIAAMELGALVCRPVPLCEKCPVSDYCAANKAGNPGAIPRPKPRRETVDVSAVGLVLYNAKGEFLVRRIAPGDWHAGLWEFPSSRPTESASEPLSFIDGLCDNLFHNFTINNLEFLQEFRYQVTHHRVRLSVWIGGFSGEQSSFSSAEYQFLPLQAISSLPMGSAQKKLFQVLNEMEFPDCP